MNQHQEDLTKYLAAFVTGLVQSGVQDVVISPGSRSTPLALLLVEHPQIKRYIQIDERSAAFFALGMAKASKKPVALLCTSGTAAANYYPAVVEADLSRVPLLVLTADRPHELRNVGAPQAIDQIHLYGQHVRWFNEMAIPDRQLVSYAKATARRAVMKANSFHKGPVHLNFPFREPLVPKLDPSPYSLKEEAFFEVEGHLTLSTEAVKKLAETLQKYEKGLIVCGTIDEVGFASAVLKLSRKLGFPILADPLSQLRSQHDPEDLIIDSYDAILKDEETVARLQPDVILRFGAMPVSKPLTLFMKRYSNIEHIVVDGGADWRDPHHLVTSMIHANETELCQQLLPHLDGLESNDWLTIWQKIDSLAKEAIRAHMEEKTDLEEGKAIYELAKYVPDQSTFFVGNSMPIRDIDTFFHKQDKNIEILANRGANGIDGVVSAAMGAAVYKQPLYLIIGDLSFFHDMNGLLAAKQQNINITIILLNNDGGGIFSYLPQAKEPKHFEVLFGTPTGLNFEHAVRLFDGQYKKVTNWDDYRSAIEESSRQVGLNVIEVPTDRTENTTSHREMWGRISREINSFLQGVGK